MIAKALFYICKRIKGGNAIRDIARIKTHDGNLRPYETNFLHLLAAMSRCVTHPLRD